MNTLDNLKQIKKLKADKVLASIENLGEQIIQVFKEFKKIQLPKSYRQVNKILVNGMGGSALGSHILRSLFFNQLKTPFGVINSYQLPASLDKNTLYVISSYSGSTEEPLATFAAAQKRRAKTFGITSGGQLGNFIKRGKLEGYLFNPVFNPSGQPRMGLGYSLAAQLALLKKLNLILVSEAEVTKALNEIRRWHQLFGFDNPTKTNLAKKTAREIKNKIPIVVTSEFLAGNAHALANQINENAKNFSTYFLISELNHHLLEGLSFPKSNRQNLFFIFLESKFYHPKNQIRYRVTRSVLTKNKIDHFTYKLSASSKLSQALEVLVFGSYLSFYLAVLNNINPTKIPWVDYFKHQLKKYS